MQVLKSKCWKTTKLKCVCGGGKQGNGPFLVTIVVKALIKVLIIAHLMKLEDLIFQEANQIILLNMQPKMRSVVAEWTKFMSMKWEPGELHKRRLDVILKNLRRENRTWKKQKMNQEHKTPLFQDVIIYYCKSLIIFIFTRDTLY